jgi:DNA helicase-2/ATP-dependent DNA helicase PcrA
MMMTGSREDLEEERRLFYVAVTRAEHRLTFSYASSRFRFGTVRPMEPSRFLNEVDAKYLKVSKKLDMEESSGMRFSDQFKRPASKSNSVAPLQIVAHTVSANFTPSDVSKLKIGLRVEHQKFGFGTVQDLDIQSPDKKAKILFDNNGEKTLILGFAKLMVVE